MPPWPKVLLGGPADAIEGTLPGPNNRYPVLGTRPELTIATVGDLTALCRHAPRWSPEAPADAVGGAPGAACGAAALPPTAATAGGGAPTAAAAVGGGSAAAGGVGAPRPASVSSNEGFEVRGRSDCSTTRSTPHPPRPASLGLLATVAPCKQSAGLDLICPCTFAQPPAGAPFWEFCHGKP